MTGDPFSLYVHVPFCDRKCPYCDFNTYAVARPPEREYLLALRAEIESYREHPAFSGRAIKSVFFGGGTPSVLSAEGIVSVLETARGCFPILDGAEITLETNPNHAEPERLKGFRNAGINRLSFGVQSFSDQTLSFLGREHTANQAREAVRVAAACGFDSVSVDIIFGVPDQTLSDLESDLREALKLPINHISTYSLTIEPGTPFFQRQERGLLKLPADERVAEMLELVPRVLEASGFRRYEISNYAQPGCESAHNLVYWRGGDYLGVGAGAHGYFAKYAPNSSVLSGERWSNLALPREYMDALKDERSVVSWRERIEINALKFEFLYLGLRCIDGVSKAEYQRRFGERLEDRYGDKLDQLRRDGFVQVIGDQVSLTLSGIALTDSVLQCLVD
jgi:oxygen-independent coproporphyrinogen-3 oxidase